MWGIDLLKVGLRKNLGNGRSIFMFNDPWLPRPTTFKVVSSPSSEVENAVVVDFITPSLQWDKVKLNHYLLREDVEVIQTIQISSSALDRWI